VTSLTAEKNSILRFNWPAQSWERADTQKRKRSHDTNSFYI